MSRYPYIHIHKHKYTYIYTKIHIYKDTYIYVYTHIYLHMIIYIFFFQAPFLNPLSDIGLPQTYFTSFCFRSFGAYAFKLADSTGTALMLPEMCIMKEKHAGPVPVRWDS